MDGVEKSKIEELSRWALGLLFSGALAGISSWYSRRKQEPSPEESHAPMPNPINIPPPPAAPGPSPVFASEGDELREMIQTLQVTIAQHTARGDERHSANLERFARVNEDLGELRQDLRGTRSENRVYMKRILKEVRSVKGSPEKDD